MHASLDPSLVFHRAVQRAEATHVRIRGHYRYADRAALDAALAQLREKLGSELAEMLDRFCRIDQRTLMFDMTVPMSSDPAHVSVWFATLSRSAVEAISDIRPCISRGRTGK